MQCNKKDTQPVGWMSYGASDEARTRYLHLGKVALYQMSYTRNSELYYSTNLACVKDFFKNLQKTFKKGPPLGGGSRWGYVG